MVCDCSKEGTYLLTLPVRGIRTAQGRKLTIRNGKSTTSKNMTGDLANRGHAWDELGLVEMKYCHLVV